MSNQQSETILLERCFMSHTPSYGSNMSSCRIIVAAVIATLCAYGVASIERREALWMEHNRVRAEPDPRLGPNGSEATERFERRFRLEYSAHKNWSQAIESGRQADIEAAREQIIRVADEVKEQEKVWAAEDARKLAAQEAGKDARHRNAMNSISSAFYLHFSLMWLLTATLCLVARLEKKPALAK